MPLYFAPSPDFEETPTLKRSNAFEIEAEECKATREAGADLRMRRDMNPFGKARAKSAL